MFFWFEIVVICSLAVIYTKIGEKKIPKQNVLLQENLSSYGWTILNSGYSNEVGTGIEKTIIHSAFTALIGAQFVSMSNAAVPMVILTWYGDNQFKEMTPRILLVVAMVTRVIQLKSLSDGLRKYDAMLFLPIYTAFLIIFATGMVQFFLVHCSFLILFYFVCFHGLDGVRWMGGLAAGVSYSSVFLNSQTPFFFSLALCLI